jgi:hypothetical protein
MAARSRIPVSSIPDRPPGGSDRGKVNVPPRDAAGEIIGLVVHFGCHRTVTEDGTEFSADYDRHSSANI